VKPQFIKNTSSPVKTTHRVSKPTFSSELLVAAAAGKVCQLHPNTSKHIHPKGKENPSRQKSNILSIDLDSIVGRV
jgi:hypothetical protein